MQLDSLDYLCALLAIDVIGVQCPFRVQQLYV